MKKGDQIFILVIGFFVGCFAPTVWATFAEWPPNIELAGYQLEVDAEKGAFLLSILIFFLNVYLLTIKKGIILSRLAISLFLGFFVQIAIAAFMVVVDFRNPENINKLLIPDVPGILIYIFSDLGIYAAGLYMSLAAIITAVVYSIFTRRKLSDFYI